MLDIDVKVITLRLSWRAFCNATDKNLWILDTGISSGRAVNISTGLILDAFSSNNCNACSKSGCAVLGERITPGSDMGQLSGFRIRFINETYTFWLPGPPFSYILAQYSSAFLTSPRARTYNAMAWSCLPNLPSISALSSSRELVGKSFKTFSAVYWVL